MCKCATRNSRVVRQRGSSTAIPATIVPSNIAAIIQGTFTVKRGHIYWTNMGIPNLNDGSIERATGVNFKYEETWGNGAGASASIVLTCGTRIAV
jgi:hypothetical protein